MGVKLGLRRCGGLAHLFVVIILLKGVAKLYKIYSSDQAILEKINAL